jgi:hypothetical protein
VQNRSASVALLYRKAPGAQFGLFLSQSGVQDL